MVCQEVQVHPGSWTSHGDEEAGFRPQIEKPNAVWSKIVAYLVWPKYYELEFWGLVKLWVMI